MFSNTYRSWTRIGSTLKYFHEKSTLENCPSHPRHETSIKFNDHCVLCARSLMITSAKEVMISLQCPFVG